MSSVNRTAKTARMPAVLGAFSTLVTKTMNQAGFRSRLGTSSRPRSGSVLGGRCSSLNLTQGSKLDGRDLEVASE
jgi:hypothetical protein